MSESEGQDISKDVQMFKRDLLPQLLVLVSYVVCLCLCLCLCARVLRMCACVLASECLGCLLPVVSAEGKRTDRFSEESLNSS